MNRTILTIALIALLTGCTSIRDYSTLMLYRAQGKVLVTVLSPCAPSVPDKPALVMEWVREKDIGKMTVLCDTSCNCKMVRAVSARRIAGASAAKGGVR